MRRAGLRQVRAPDGRAPAQKIALWAMNDFGWLAGYTAAQIGASYSGQPAVFVQFDAFIGQFVGQIHDGAIVVSGGASTFWFVVPPALQTVSRSVDSSKLRRVPVPAGSTRAKLVAQFPNRDVMLSGQTGLRLPLGQLYAGPSPGTVVTGLATSAAPSDALADSTGNLWIVDSGAETLTRFTAASVAAAGAAAADKAASGSNFAGITGMAMDANGGLWHSSYSGGSLRYHDSTAVGALNGTPSNPAPTRSVTGLVGGPQGIVLDRSGGAWVAAYDTGALHYFTPAQLAAGGAQAPARTITTPLVDCNSIRLSADAALPWFGPR